MSGLSLVHIKLPSTTPAADEAASAGYVTTEIAKKNTTPGAGLALNADGIAYDVVAGADGALLVGADDITVAPKGIATAHIADGAVGNLQSSVTLGGLNNVDITVDTAAAIDYVLTYDGTEWVAGALAAGVTAGAGILETAGAFDVVAGADGSLLVGTDDITVAPKGIATAHIADGAVGNLQSSVTLGGLNNVNISVDSTAVAGDALVYDGTEWVSGGPATGATAGLGLVKNATTTDLDVVAADTSIVVTADAIAVGVIQAANLAYGAVGNEALSATLGGLNNVDITADAPADAGSLLSWDGTEWLAVPPAAAGSLDSLSDVDVTTVAAVAGDTIVYDGTTGWAAGARVDLTTDQTVGGIKTFSVSPVVPAITGASATNLAVDKKYVDDSVSLISGQNQAIGIYDATTDLVTTVFAGAPAGVVVGALPAASATNAGSYFLVNLSGAAGAAYPTAGAGDWLISDGAAIWSIIPISGAYLTQEDIPSVGDITGSYAAGFQLGPLSVGEPELVDFSVTNIKLGAQLGALTDVTLAGVSDPAPTITGVGLVWDGTAWAASVDSVVVGTLALDDLSDVTAPTPVAGDHLVYDGTAAAWVPTAAGVAVQKFVAAVGDDAALSIPVTHNLNTTDVTVQAWQGVDAVNVGVATAGVNAVTVTFAVAPATDAVRVVVIG